MNSGLISRNVHGYASICKEKLSITSKTDLSENCRFNFQVLIIILKCIILQEFENIKKKATFT